MPLSEMPVFFSPKPLQFLPLLLSESLSPDVEVIWQGKMKDIINALCLRAQQIDANPVWALVALTVC